MKQVHAQHVRGWMRLLTLVLCTMFAASAIAQPLPARPISDADLPWADGDDPIGVRRNDAELDRGATNRPSADAQAFGPKPPASSTRRGDVLTAPALVREIRHVSSVAWAQGVALITTVMVFTTTSDLPAEARYRLPVVDGAKLGTFAVCEGERCRDGVTAENTGLHDAYDDAVQSRGDTDLPIGRARILRDERGPYVEVSVAPVRKDREVRAVVKMVVETELHNGVIRLTLPARGRDERAATAEVEVEAHTLTGLALNGQPLTTNTPAMFEPWQPIEIVGRLPTTQGPVAEILSAVRGDGSAHVWIAAPAVAAPPVDLVIWLDASPSMRGPARGRIPATLDALLSLTPADTQVTSVVFAADANAVGPTTRAEDVALLRLIDALQREDLGSATRLASAWDALGEWTKRAAPRAPKKLIVWIGDGRIGRGQEHVFDRARRADIEIASVNLSDHTTDATVQALVASTGGVAIDVGKEANGLASGQRSGALEDRLALLLAPVAVRHVKARARHAGHSVVVDLGELRAGSSRVWSGRATDHVDVHLDGKRMRLPTDTTFSPHRYLGQRFGMAFDHLTDGPLLAVDPIDLPRAGQDWPPPSMQCDPRGPARRVSGVSSDAQPVSLASSRSCRPAAPVVVSNGAAPGAGMPSSPLLSMLRQRLMPVARGCFRSDRAGRAEYELRAVFELELFDQEVAAANVTGQVPETLRQCLLDAATRLEVPLFTGVVRARYPLRTQSEPLPEEIELTPAVAADLDRLLDGDRGALHTPPAF